MESLLPGLELGAPLNEAEMTVILMHGLGADGYDFADVAEALAQSAAPRKWRFVLPHAPEMPVTINMGMRMPAWYDILDLSHPREVNWATVDQGQRMIEALMAREKAPTLVLAGFSQGGAMALQVGLRNQSRIAGIISMSGYLLFSENQTCPEKEADFPIGMFHGNADQVVALQAAQTGEAKLKEKGYLPTLKVYPGLPHSVSPVEIQDVFNWLSHLRV
jgi:phospholipase/carboxylesterase